MAKINYYLKGAPSKEKLSVKKNTSLYEFEKDVHKERPIICSISYDGKRLILATGKKVSLKYWDSSKQNIKTSVAGTPQSAKELHKWLNDKLNKVDEYLEYQIFNDEYIDKEVIKGIYINKGAGKENPTLAIILAQFINEHRTQSGYCLKKQTVKKYKVLINHIIKFQGDDILISKRITTYWIENFKFFLNNTMHQNDNSVSKYVRSLKTLIKYLRKKGYLIPATLEEIKVPERQQIVNIIEENELEHLRNFEFDNTLFSQIRDVFIFQCYTGQRFSDIQKISRRDISTSNKVAVWLLCTQKTDDFISIPLANSLLTILDKYKELTTPLPVFSNQYFNKMLKVIAAVVGLTRNVKRIEFINNHKKEFTFPLCDLISSHIARKTFISLSLKKNMPERYIRIISGHKNEKSFKAYVNTGDAHFDSFLETWL